MEVENACQNLGVARELLEAKPSALGASLGAEYIVVGTASVVEAERLP